MSWLMLSVIILIYKQKAITNQEMKDTQGAFGVPGAVAGAGIGAWGYLGLQQQEQVILAGKAWQ